MSDPSVPAAAPSDRTAGGDRRLSASMVRLRARVPFFGTLALYARFVADPSMPTAATDGRDVFYNPEFFASLPAEHLDAVIVHEVLHAALGHVHRRGERDAMRWNQAADVVVNGLIADAGMELPEGALRDSALEHFSVEEVYTLIERAPTERDPVDRDLLDARPDGAPSPDIAPARPSDRAGDDARHWAPAVERAATVARTRRAGTLPAGLERAFALTDRPRLDWRAVLWRFVTRTPTDFAAFDRRHLHRGLYLETLESVGLTLVVAIDTSGSIAEDDLAAFANELDAMLRAYPATNAHLVYADAEAYGPFPIGPGDPLPPPIGGGGTDFRPFFSLCDSEGLVDENTVAVYLTDGFGAFPDEPPDVPVLWVVSPGGLDDDQFPFGTVARMGS